MRIAYFDCFSGAGGDMIVAAMLDAGLDKDRLAAQLGSLKVAGLEIHVERTTRRGMSALKFTPHAGHEHAHRHLDDIIDIIERSAISDSARRRAAAVFHRLAEAEAKVHGTTPGEIHFHEVGAVDSIADVVSACIGFDAMGIDTVLCSTLRVGGGTVKCDHGLMPVPAPATLELLRQAKAPFEGGPIERELLTPTAAAILTEFAAGFGPMPPMRVSAIGLGAGTLDAPQLPNVLRLVIGESAHADADTDCIAVLEANIDDATPEAVGFAMDAVLAAGALDAYTTPIGMKHSRPAVMLSVLCEPGVTATIEGLLFEQGLTLGVRRQYIQRSKLPRDIITVVTPYGDIHVKRGFARGRCVFAKPEYADCAAASQRSGASFKTVHEAALNALQGRKEQ